MRILVTTTVIFMLTACASTEKASSEAAPTSAEATTAPQADAESSEKGRLVCRNEKVIGSNKKVRTCSKVEGS